MSDKPREFWINGYEKHAVLVAHKNKERANDDRTGDCDGTFHVIEYKAVETLRAQLDDAKDLLRDAGFLLIPNAPKLSHRICIFLAKLEELETPKCICGEINARHCPVHQELEKCDKGE